MYQVEIHAKNLVILMEDELRRAGMYCYRVVSAPSAEAAGPLAVARLTGEREFLDEIRNDPGDAPTFHVESVRELEADEDPEERETGRVYYTESESDEEAEPDEIDYYVAVDEAPEPSDQ